MMRGVAALTVFLGHVRALMFVDYPYLNHRGPIEAVLYAAAGLGHPAVIVFFVLSGFFVGGSVIGRSRSGTFQIKPYATARLGRLYSALVPALVLGAALDFIGTHYVRGPVYTPGYAYVVPYTLKTSLTPAVFLGNLEFLQTITVPELGTNGPLWSLANEFWYYVAFPCAMIAISGKFKPFHRILAASLGVAVFVLVRGPILSLFGVWLVGAAVALVPRAALPRWTVAVAWAAVFAALVYARASHGNLASDYLLGVTAGAGIYFASCSQAIWWAVGPSGICDEGSLNFNLMQAPA